MPLKIELKPGERAVLNGVVIEGASDGRTEFVILNRATIMRERHILKEEDANSPVKRLYFALQMLYIEPAQKTVYLPLFDRYAADLENTLTLPTLKFALEQIVACAKDEVFYEALKICRAMMETEERLFEYGQQLKEEKGQPDLPPVPDDVDFESLAAKMKARAAADGN
ncbi:MAG TPA: flagellar biosynthesis repressor FlbT [Alphaproteobacteria bacterium]|nr:flagellar biosynthesis repressor FlbT [Alphaproteobacteria bacterium]